MRALSLSSDCICSTVSAICAYIRVKQTNATEQTSRRTTGPLSSSFFFWSASSCSKKVSGGGGDPEAQRATHPLFDGIECLTQLDCIRRELVQGAAVVKEPLVG